MLSFLTFSAIGLEFDDPSESSAAKPSKDAEIVKKDEERTPGFKSALPLKERSSTGPRTKKKKIAVTDPKNKRSSLPAPKVVQAEEKKETKIAQAEEKKDSKTAQAEEKKEGKIAQTEEKKETKVVQAAEKKTNSPKSHKKAPSIVEDIELLDIDIDMDVDPLDRNKNEILAKVNQQPWCDSDQFNRNFVNFAAWQYVHEGWLWDCQNVHVRVFVCCCSAEFR